jgi:hypothetical protein
MASKKGAAGGFRYVRLRLPISAIKAYKAAKKATKGKKS